MASWTESDVTIGVFIMEPDLCFLVAGLAVWIEERPSLSLLMSLNVMDSLSLFYAFAIGALKL